MQSTACTVAELHASLSRREYTVAELRCRPLPDNVDAKQLEQYLNDVDFQSVFDMSKQAFAQLPQWKQARLRRDKNMF